jgi:hypothetical protein
MNKGAVNQTLQGIITKNVSFTEKQLDLFSKKKRI